jgi:hypothetical protein
MQIAHLFLVDAIWISYILFAANFTALEHFPATAESEI